MVEYDFHIALEHAERNGHDYVMEFPKSCVLYIRYGKNIPDRLSVKVIFPDNSTHTYQIPTVRIYEYDKEEIMKKSLFFLLPYYILRYENALSKIEKSEKRMETLSAEYKEIESDLCKFLQDKNPGLLVDLMKIIKNVADYVLRDHQSTRKELDQIMGGKVLELESERLYKKGNSEGQKQILQLMQKITPEDDIKKLYSGNKEYINELLKKYNIK